MPLRAACKIVAKTHQKRLEQDWYSISVSSLRRGLTLLGLVLTLIGSALVYQQWEQHTRRDRAVRAIEEARLLTDELEERDDFDQIRIEHHIAWEDLEDAEAEFEAERYGPALTRARAAVRELDSIFDLGQTSSERKSRFLSVQGGVEYRRGERGTWTRARTNDSLNPGDWVKTSNDGTAEIRFPDGSTYVLRHDTLVHLGSLIETHPTEHG